MAAVAATAAAAVADAAAADAAEADAADADADVGAIPATTISLTGQQTIRCVISVGLVAVAAAEEERRRARTTVRVVQLRHH